MSERDDRLPMHHMLEHAREAVETIRGRARAELRTNRLLQHTLVHLVQIVGEAATRVSPEGQSRYPEIPWSLAIATRHRMVHGYDIIDYDVVWETIAGDFPPLVAALERALSGEPT
jgi:uncharacterized protein with HEPN domain